MKMNRGTSANHQREFSEVLLEFIEEIIPEPLRENPFWIDLAMAVWNLALLPEELRGKEQFLLAQRLDAGHEKIPGLTLANWVELRLSHYGKDRRVAIRWEQKPSKKGATLEILSADLDAKDCPAEFVQQYILKLLRTF